MEELKFESIAEIIECANKSQRKVSEIVLEQQANQMEISQAAVFDKMRETYSVMVQSVESGIQPGVRSVSGLSGGDAYRLLQAGKNGKDISGGVFFEALVRALAVSEWNAAMGCIVAAPTAGSCGFLPAALLSFQKQYGFSEEDCVMALFTASAIGMVVANVAYIAGAQGGCQAECGTAAAMAAAAIVELCNGTPDMIGHAVSITFGNVLGLVCDPVAGLVEIPCIHRNASGVANALVGAQLALAGIKSLIPADETILAMKRVGDAMPVTLKETAEGGLATTPTAKTLYTQVFNAQEGTACRDCNGCNS
ncbi:MAG TPA: L-serine ammonia-lyase, iron-sulfur-dependent, subunit alpha [Clostridiales bacterium]|nr:L-serine ammonia-lyase, iron-sulfur-dependent, subunit alpha [Clostridiales bacterium]